MVQVKLSRQQPTFLGAILGRSSLTVTSQAVAARQRGYANSHTLVALSQTDCPGAQVHGTGTIHVYAAAGVTAPGGYVQVNSNCAGGSTADDACSNGTGALKAGGSAILYAPRIDIVGSCQQASTGQVKGPVDEAAAYQGDPLASLQAPRFDPNQPGQPCGLSGTPTAATGPQANGCGSSQMPWIYSPDANCPGLPNNYKCVELKPGVYFGGWDISNKLRLIYNTDNPKASCPAGSSAGCQQDLELTAGGSLQLAGLLKTSPCPPATTVGGCPYGGMVIWDDGNGSQGYTANVKISGGTTLNISGTIYAPKAAVWINGNSGTNTAGPTCPAGATQTASVQIIAWTWDVGGTGDLCMPYDPSKLYQLNQQGLVR
ncbi:MAG: hypothetical protein LC721_11410 [Actinobacteria bacterium]|nr:hypothetical protein [Actinomycetota bacterium]